MSVLVIPEFENERENEGVDEIVNDSVIANDSEPDAPQFAESDTPEVLAATDERANIPVSETAERFLRAVLAKVPLDRIEELHLFSPLRQGTAETGIAVIAARVIVPDEPVGPDLELQLEAAPDVESDDEIENPLAADEWTAAREADERVAADAAAEQIAADASGDQMAADASDETATADASHETEPSEEAEPSPYADDPLPVAAEDALDFAHELAPDVADELEVAPRPPRVRHTVYTARYRLVVKGPDRGKWEMDVVDEADAPLLAVETVVRGVQRRAGEETATVRYDAAQLARALRITPVALP